jgi:hypothetical protein
MKIGILTFHEIYNPGAYLQAYATCATIKSLGHVPQIINYTSPNHRFRPWHRLLRRPDIPVRHPKLWIETFQRHLAFRKVHHHLKPTHRLNTHLALENEQFDYIIIGADIVWNYQSLLWGNDPVYFGRHLNCKQLIAYAPSCGPLDIDAPIPSFVRDGLLRFNSIAVRDDKTAVMVHRAIGKEVPVIMDPTFDLETQSLPVGSPIPEHKYILIYAMPNLLSTRAIKQIREFASAEGCKIIAVCYRQSWADTNIITANPFDWVSLIRHADWVFTNSFHGTIFSAKLRKQFVTEYNDAIKSKILPVMTALGLQDRVFSEHSDVAQILKKRYNTENVTRQIREIGLHGRDYLKKALNCHA